MFKKLNDTVTWVKFIIKFWRNRSEQDTKFSETIVRDVNLRNDIEARLSAIDVYVKSQGRHFK